jgi:hypothetical protein
METNSKPKEFIGTKVEEPKRLKTGEEQEEKETEGLEVKMKENQDSGEDSEEESDMDTTQAMELEKIEIDLSSLREIHGMPTINSLIIV